MKGLFKKHGDVIGVSVVILAFLVDIGMDIQTVSVTYIGFLAGSLIVLIWAMVR